MSEFSNPCHHIVKFNIVYFNDYARKNQTLFLCIRLSSGPGFLNRDAPEGPPITINPYLDFSLQNPYIKRMKTLIRIIFLITTFILSVASTYGQSSVLEIDFGLEKTPSGRDAFIPYYQFERPKIGVALSGGGARGLAQIGVLKVFEKNGLPIDCITGTSIGAVIGGLFSVGYTATEIESIAYQIHWDEIIQDKPPRRQLFLGQKEERDRHLIQFRLKGMTPIIPVSYTAGQKLGATITNLILNAPHPPSTDFSKMHIPFQAITTDLVSGKKVILKSGSLINALRASMAIPLLFSPIPMGNAQLVDGGLVQNMPVEEVRQMSSDIVIAVNTSSPLLEKTSLNLPWKIADQVTTIMQQERTRSQLDSADIVIEPNLQSISNTDFKEIDYIIKSGENAAENAFPEIEKWLTRNASRQKATYKIQAISLEGCINLKEDQLRKTIRIMPSSSVSLEEIVWTSRQIYQSGDIEHLSVLLDTSNHALIFRVKENPRIDSITIEGNTLFPDSLIFSKMEIQPSCIYNTHLARKDKQNILDVYFKAGYSLARIHSFIENEILNMTITEGKIDSICLYGNKRTRSYVIKRELAIRKGDVFNSGRLKSGIDNVFSTGYFHDIRFNLKDENNHNKLQLFLEEKEYTLLRLGFRYDLERYAQGFVSLVEENIFGFGGVASFTGLIGRKDEMLQAKFRADRLFKTMLTYNIYIQHLKKDYNYYDDYKKIGEYETSLSSASFSIGQQMKRLGTLSVQVCTETIDIQSVDNFSLKESYNLRNIKVRSEVDTRDRIPFPNSGNHHLLEYETATSFLGSEISYTRLFSFMEFYYPLLAQRLVFHPGLVWGSADKTTPFIKQFRLGGFESFMGMHEDAFIGKRYLVLNTELRCTISWPSWLESYISLRFDLGGIWGRYAAISTKDFKIGTGAFLGFGTPFGPIYIGYGKTGDKSGEGEFYFNAGYRF